MNSIDKIRKFDEFMEMDMPDREGKVYQWMSDLVIKNRGSFEVNGWGFLSGQTLENGVDYTLGLEQNEAFELQYAKGIMDGFNMSGIDSYSMVGNYIATYIDEIKEIQENNEA